jgi:hypothetical protein
MCDRAGKFHVSHAFPTNLRKGYFNPTLFTDYASMLEALVFSAEAFVILDRTKNTGAKKSITFWFERPVINRFGFFYLAERPRSDQVWSSQPDPERVEFVRWTVSLP